MTSTDRQSASVTSPPPIGGSIRGRSLARAGVAAVITAAIMAAGVPSAAATDTLPWGRFNPDWAAGENQPYNHGYTGLDLLHWSPEADVYSQYLRSRVPLQERIDANAATQRDSDLPADTQMLNLAGDYGNAFFESFHDNNVFSQYLFNYWQYTDFYATWHGQPTQDVDKDLYDIALNDPVNGWQQRWFEFGMMNLPNPAYTNAAHRNGVRALATIFFSDNDRGEQTYHDLLVGRRDDGTFPVADKLVEVAEYFGFDGYFINQESDVDPGDVEAYQDFIRQLTDAGMYVQWYDSAEYPDGAVSYQNEFNDRNSPWVQADDGKVSDSIFLNYWYTGDMLKDSAAHAESLGLDPKAAVFAGIEAGQKKFDAIDENSAYMQTNLDGNGDPYVSIAALGTDFVSHELGDDKKVKAEYQNEVFDRERRLWTGSSTGDGTDVADGWEGFDSQIAERSVIGGTVFNTTFNTGHGLEWRDGGEVTGTGEWGDINLQDVPVTWQWWIDADSDPLQADFDYGERYTAADRFDYTKIGAYEGGSSLVLSGRLSSDNTIRLFKTDLDVTDGSVVNLTYNKQASDDSALQLGLVFADDPGTVVPVDVADGARTDGWKTASVDLSAYAGRSIATIGLIAKAGAAAIDGWQVNIGRLQLTDGADYTPATPADLTIGTLDTDTQELTVDWTLDDYERTRNYLLYLDDTFLGGRYDCTYYVKHLPATSGTLRLYAVGKDGSRSLAAEAPLDQSKAATGVTVQTDADGTATVSWTAPASAGETTVTLATDRGSRRYAEQPFSVSATVDAGTTSVTFDGVPVDGSRYIAQVRGDGVVSTARGTFTDTTIEPYPLDQVVWDGDSVTLARPDTQDWRFLRVIERWEDNGEAKEEPRTFAAEEYIYNAVPNDEAQQAGITNDALIRGRSRAGSFMIAPKHGGDLYVSVEDYASNVTEPVRIPTADEMEDLSVDDPTQPDAARSLIEAVDGEAQADGEQTRSVKVSVRDSFGNPLPGVEVAFTLPEGIASALDGAAITVVTGSDGRATIAVTSQTAGEYVIDASVNGATIGDGATVTFSAVPGTSQDPDDDTDDADGDQQDGTHNQGTAGGGADQNATGPLSSTGSAIIAVIVVTVACVAAGAGIMLRRRRSS